MSGSFGLLAFWSLGLPRLRWSFWLSRVAYTFACLHAHVARVVGADGHSRDDRLVGLRQKA